jgi:hypothetical protein
MAHEPHLHINKENRLELITGLLIAIFAAVLSIAELGSGKYGKLEILTNNQKNEAYQTVQSKSIKQILYESHRDFIKSIISSGIIDSNKKGPIDEYEADLNKDIIHYEKEKIEVLKGSDVVGKENWVQKQGGELGKIIGAEEWAAKSNKLAEACDTFDLAVLFLQVCLVMGAISLVIKQDKLKKIFLFVMLTLGAIGLIYGSYAFMLTHAI